jgi:hypothetical protein
MVKEIQPSPRSELNPIPSLGWPMRISMETPKPSLAAPNVGLPYHGVVVCRGYALALVGSAPLCAD